MVNSGEFGAWIRTRRHHLGITQQELAHRAGVPQPTISAVEAGRRNLGPVVRARISAVLRVRPSRLVDEHREEARAALAAHGLTRPRLFGSVARGTDTPDSDLDLLVAAEPGFDPLDVEDVERHLAELLSVAVDLVLDVDRPSSREFLDAIRAEAVDL